MNGERSRRPEIEHGPTGNTQPSSASSPVKQKPHFSRAISTENRSLYNSQMFQLTTCSITSETTTKRHTDVQHQHGLGLQSRVSKIQHYFYKPFKSRRATNYRKCTLVDWPAIGVTRGAGAPPGRKLIFF